MLKTKKVTKEAINAIRDFKKSFFIKTKGFIDFCVLVGPIFIILVGPIHVTAYITSDEPFRCAHAPAKDKLWAHFPHQNDFFIYFLRQFKIRKFFKKKKNEKKLA